MRTILVAIIACVAMIGSTLILSYTYKTRNRANDVISVTGLAKQDFVSDLIVWKGSFVRRDKDLRVAYGAGRVRLHYPSRCHPAGSLGDPKDLGGGEVRPPDPSTRSSLQGDRGTGRGRR
jgi:hypothetical protein